MPDAAQSTVTPASAEDAATIRRAVLPVPRPGVRDLRFRHLRVLRGRHRSRVLPVHRSRGLAARQLRDLCRRVSVSSGRRHRHRLLRRPLWAAQGAGGHRRDDGLRDRHHRAHSILRRNRALGANSAGAVPHVPRLLTGGEWGGAAAFLVEHAPAGRRGLIGSFQQAATAIGAMGATFSAAILSSSLSPDSFFAWGCGCRS